MPHVPGEFSSNRVLVDTPPGVNESFLNLTFTAGTTNRLNIVLLMEVDGEPLKGKLFTHTHSTGSIATTDSVLFSIPDGVITGLVVSIVSSVKRGEAYARIFLQQANINVIELSSGYVYDQHGLRLGHHEDPLDGKGRVRIISLGNPAAGSDYTAEVVPFSARWRVRSFVGDLVTDANAANRFLSIEYNDGTNDYAQTGSTTATTASGTTDFRGGLGLDLSHIDGQVSYFPLPDVYMVEQDELQFTTLNIQAGDDWGEGFIEVEEWIEV